MITNNGKNILAKYLLGQAPAYASYIVVGCGKPPLTTGDPIPNNATKENLDFEMFRVPISSRGLVNDAGETKIVLTAELPTEERYEITEVGLYSAGSNPSAAGFDSRTIFAFTQSENWQYHNQSSTSSINTYLNSLDATQYDNIIAINDKVFQTNADNVIFYKSPRFERYERCRFLNNILMMSGDTSDLTIDINNHFEINSGSDHIHLTAPNIDFSKNSPIDELRLAFSIINKDGTALTSPDSVRILVDFASTDETTGEFARFEAEVENTGNQFDTNRYHVVSKQLQELYTTPNFTWNAVTVVKIYFSAIVSGVPSSDYFIALDAMRFENIATVNPLYGLVGYSIVQNDDASAIIKSPNTTNYIEFRFGLGVS